MSPVSPRTVACATLAGPLASVVTCRIGARTLNAPLTLSWTLTYG